LLGVVVQVTGLEPNSATSKAIVASFKALKEFATFDDSEEGESDGDVEDIADTGAGDREERQHITLTKGLGLSYTINLHLPPTSDIKVFDAIFKSLRENLLQ
jgi:hypothetical protein